MDFKQIEAFVNVIKYRSFSKAADVLFLTQPTISAHINSLERELGVALIDRSNREALPTKQGRLLFNYGLDMLNLRERALYDLKESISDMDFVFELQTSSVPGEYLLPPLLSSFRKEYPLTRFFLEQSDSASVILSLIEGRSELGFTGNKGDSSLEYLPLIKDHMVLITPKTDKFLAIAGLSQNKGPLGYPYIKVKDFIEEAFIYREQGSGTMKELEEGLHGLGYSGKKLNAVMKINSMQAIKQAVACNMGVSIISRIAVEDGASKGDFIAFEIEELSFNRYFYLVHRKKGTLSPAAETFKRFTLGYFKGEGL